MTSMLYLTRCLSIIILPLVLLNRLFFPCVWTSIMISSDRVQHFSFSTYHCRWPSLPPSGLSSPLLLILWSCVRWLSPVPESRHPAPVRWTPIMIHFRVYLDCDMRFASGNGTVGRTGVEYKVSREFESSILPKLDDFVMFCVWFIWILLIIMSSPFAVFT